MVDWWCQSNAQVAHLETSTWLENRCSTPGCMLNANMQAAARRQLHSAIIRDEPGGFEARAAPVRRYFRARRPDQSTAAGHAKERDGT
jgi:hypothetical protein